MFIKKKIKIIFISVLFILLPNLVKASDDFIISDYDFQNYKSMTVDDIKYFLEKHNSPLKLFVQYNDLTHKKEWAWEIIYNASQYYKINPQVILTLLQKEQSLIIGSPYNLANRLNWAMGYAVCDSCSIWDFNIQQYKGFAKQVNNATRLLRSCFDKKTNNYFQVNKEYIIDGKKITIKNQSTACLYSYTPHLHGNQNFQKIWQRWFANKYNNNTLIKDINDQSIYLLKYGIRHKITSPSLLENYKNYPLIELNSWEIKQYPEGSEIKYPLYTLLGVKGDGIYLISEENTVRKIANKTVFQKLGYQLDEIEDVSADEIAQYKRDKDITEKDLYPLGFVVQNLDSGDYYYIYQNERYLILDPRIIQNYLHLYKIGKIKSTDLNQYKYKDVLLYPDGTLLKEDTSPNVYLIQNGKKHLIANEYTFKQLKYKWSDIIKCNYLILQKYPDGETIDYESIDQEFLLNS